MEQLGPQFTPERLKPALEYIEAYWKKLERFTPHDDGTLVGLPRPYFVPSVSTGSGFQFEELYYWDTFFIAQGFLGTAREHMIKGLADDILTLQQRFHMVPHASRTYHTGKSQIPFLTTLILQVYDIEKNKRWLDQAMTTAKDEYRSVWMGSSHPHWRQVFNGLSRFYQVDVLDEMAETESGWDHTPRFERKALSYLPVDLNALLYKYEKDFEKAASILGEKEEANEWNKRAMARKNMIMKYMWNEEKGFYFDYNFMTGKQGPIYSLAGYFPMWAGMEDAENAAKIVQNLEHFEYDGGLSCTAEKPYFKEPVPMQWSYPNGWANLHLIVVEALEKYGYHIAAERIARKWLNCNLVRFEDEGAFFEKYNVVKVHEEAKDGVYPSQVGFGWTNAVFVRFCQKYLHENEIPEIKSAAELPPLKQLVRNPRKTLKRVGVKLNSVPKRLMQ
jgi:alpha,alpha-trehalase